MAGNNIITSVILSNNEISLFVSLRVRETNLEEYTSALQVLLLFINKTAHVLSQ